MQEKFGIKYVPMEMKINASAEINVAANQR
jgi:hypothetical protein